MSKEQISNLFANQLALKENKLTPLIAIDEYIQQHGIQRIKIKTYFYSSCDSIPDPAELNETDKNLMVLTTASCVRRIRQNRFTRMYVTIIVMLFT